MALDLNNVLVIGVSSRALFDLEEENLIFENKGIEAYRKYQLQNEEKPLKPGSAFHLIKNILNLNQLTKNKIIEVVIMSKNSPETGMRMLNSLNNYDLDITRMAFTGGEPLNQNLIDGYYIDLFLSKNETDVQIVIDSGLCAAATIMDSPLDYQNTDDRVKIAFDADAVLFSEESELRYKTEGMASFHQFEQKHENEPLKEGPFASLLKKLSNIQSELPERIELSPLRIAIVTARNAPSHLRVIKTLRKWGVYVDEVYFLGGWPKRKILQSFGAQIFFDDQVRHLKDTCRWIPSGQVPYNSASPLRKIL
ncbi:5'-nucleotidase [Winogradskyella endarachnes]|uniref:5'-nucleotidase n=1 Tax=Winogradskyella endarachnes TaxID=2681965 RepID=A0A6L6UAH0_9FLAO|nr:5'-nucleotidase [Winogradskyella endarachnes]MUU79335.1 5'-nucleotidase [Winogradskyella endarachnes]